MTANSLPERVESLSDLLPLHATALTSIRTLPAPYLDACGRLLEKLDTSARGALTRLINAGQTAPAEEYPDILDALHAVNSEIAFIRQTANRLTWRRYTEEEATK